MTRSREQVHLLRLDVFELVSAILAGQQHLRLFPFPPLTTLLDFKGGLKYDFFNVRDTKLI